jgi:Leucine-rich repeat (LRR) protein
MIRPTASGIFVVIVGVMSTFNLFAMYAAQQSCANTLVQLLSQEQITINIRDNLDREKLAWYSRILANQAPALRIKVENITDDNIKYLLSLCGKVYALNLSGNKLSYANTQALASSDTLKCLSSLILSKSCIGSPGVTVIAGSLNLNSLSVLDLSKNDIGDSGAMVIANSKNFINLKQLNLGANKISSEGVKKIAKSENLINLSDLNLCNNDLDDEGAEELAKTETLDKLCSLELCSCKISDVGVLSIAFNGNLKNLKKFYFSGNGISSQTGSIVYRYFSIINGYTDWYPGNH